MHGIVFLGILKMAEIKETEVKVRKWLSNNFALMGIDYLNPSEFNLGKSRSNYSPPYIFYPLSL